MKANIITILFFCNIFNTIGQGQFDLNLVFEGTGKYEISNYGKFGNGETSIIITLHNGLFITHPLNTKIYQCDRVIGKNCDSFKREYLILQKGKKYGVVDFDGKEIFPINSELMPQYDCENKKWSFVKAVDNSKSNLIQMDDFQTEYVSSSESEMEAVLKQYKFVHSFNNGYYWVSEGDEYDKKGGGLLSYENKWIIPMSNDYWYKDYDNTEYFEIVPTATKYAENSEEESHFIKFDSGKKIYSRKDQWIVKLIGNKMIYNKRVNPDDPYEIKQAIYDFSTGKDLIQLPYDILNIFDDVLVIAEKDWYITKPVGLYSLKASKMILPIAYKKIEQVNSNYFITTDYNDFNDVNTYRFKIFEKKILNSINKKKK